ncbi:uncharacterized protein [Clytia hemisphaerica]
MNLSNEIKALCLHLLSKSNEENLKEVCIEIKNTFSISKDTNQQKSFIIWLLKSWSFSSSNKHSQTFGFGCHGNLETHDVCQIVEILNIEDDFVQVLFLLPESKKYKLVNHLCEKFNKAPQNHHQLRQALIKYTFTEYCPNFIASCTLNYCSKNVQLFFNNLTSILELTANHDQGESLIYLLIGLDCLLDDQEKTNAVKLDPYNTGSFIKRDILRIEQYKRSCASKLDSNISQAVGQIKSSPNFDVTIERFVNTLITVLTSNDNVIVQCDHEQILVSVAMKLRCHRQERESSFSGTIQSCLALLLRSYSGEEMELLTFICCEASSEEIGDLATTANDYSPWKYLSNGVQLSNTA